VARLPVKIYRANLKENRANRCQCRIHYDDVKLTEGAPGFVKRLQAITERAGWYIEVKNPTWLLLRPSGRELSSNTDSVIKGVRNAARLENMSVRVSRQGGSDVGVTGDFGEAFDDGLLEIPSRTLPEPVLDAITDAVNLIESLGWSVRARLPGEWWIIPVEGKRSAESVAARLGVEVLRSAPEGVWISVPD
jgi:hypothetical protein